MNKKLIHPVDEKYISFLSDESKQEGFADTISFPSSPEELLQIIASPLPLICTAIEKRRLFLSCMVEVTHWFRLISPVFYMRL